ncbi:hypothetical protein HDV00_009296 [Rhizophlyctis rosea]|nr:hypothetical protein HDV00_009296 [Rhizophlyctis rosea]
MLSSFGTTPEYTMNTTSEQQALFDTGAGSQQTSAAARTEGSRMRLTGEPRDIEEAPTPAGSPRGVMGGGYPKAVVMLRPVANASPLGLAAWASAAFVFGSWLAEWYGTDDTALTIWPFLLTFGGLGQLAAGMWSFHARDTFGTLFHTIWGAFWSALAIYYASIGTFTTTAPPAGTRWGHLQNFAIWQIPIACVTLMCAMVAIRRDLWQVATYFLMSIGSILIVIGWFATSRRVIKAGAYFWLFSALASLYRVCAYLFEDVARINMPVFKIRRLQANRPNAEMPANDLGGNGWDTGMRECGVVRGEW